MSNDITKMREAKQRIEKELEERINSFAREYTCKVRLQHDTYQATVVGQCDCEVSRIKIEAIF